MLTSYIVLAILTFIGFVIGVPVCDKLRGHGSVDWGGNIVCTFIAGLIWPVSWLVVIGFGVKHVLPVMLRSPGEWIDENVIDKIVAKIENARS